MKNEVPINEIPMVNLNLDEAVLQMIHLRAFDIQICKEILNIKPEDELKEMRLVANIGMLKGNEERIEAIESQIKDVITESNFFNILEKYTSQANDYVSIVVELYNEAKGELNYEE